MANEGVSRRHFFYGALLAGAVPAGGFGSTPSLKKLGLQIAQRETEHRRDRRGRQGQQRHRRMRADREHRRHGRPGRRSARPATFKRFRERPEVQRLPARCSTRKARTSTPSSSPIPDHMHATRGDVGDGARQARLLSEAADPHRVGGAQLTRGRREIQGRHADGQPGIFATRRARVRRDHLERRHRQRHRSPCLDRPPARIGRRAPRSCRRKRRSRRRSIGICWLGGSRAIAPVQSGVRARINWRGFPDFGCGALGDMACHILGTPNMALRLGASDQRRVHQEGGHGEVHVPDRTRSPLRLPGARRHAAA